MYYLTDYTFIKQLQHKMKLGFKLNNIETIIFCFYAIALTQAFIDYIKSKEFINYIKKYKIIRR